MHHETVFIAPCHALKRLRCGVGAAALLAAALWLTGCDAQRLSELQPGVSTEADVRQRLGAPEAVWEAAGGARIFEYNRQPNGHENYHITLEADGRLLRIEQVLTPARFAQVLPGMAMEDVRRLLGRPMKTTTYPLTQETHHDWRWRDGPNQSDSKVFTVIFDTDLRVRTTQSVRDPDLDRNR